MTLNLEESISSKQIVNQIELAVKDVSNIKEKHTNSKEDYEKIRNIIEQLQSKTKEVKLGIENGNEDIDLVDWQKQNISIESSKKKLEQYKTEFEQLKKGKLSHQVRLHKLYYIICFVILMGVLAISNLIINNNINFLSKA